MSVPTLVGDALAVLTQEQCGALSRAQARMLGISDGAIRAQLCAGRWQRVLPGVFVTFTGPVPYRTRCWAALLYAGAGAALSHATAAWYDGWLAEPGCVVHVTVPHSRRVAAQPLLSVHRSVRLSRDVRSAVSPPRTRTERTVLDLVDASRTARDAVAVVAQALSRRVTTEARLREALDRSVRIRWRATVVRTLSLVADGAESPLEIDHERIERSHGLPACDRQVRMSFEGRVCRVDAVDTYGLVRELDGRLGHEDARSSWRDKRRDNANVALGRAVLRFGHVDLIGDPCGVASQEVQALRHRGWTGTPKRCGPRCTAVSPGKFA